EHGGAVLLLDAGPPGRGELLVEHRGHAAELAELSAQRVELGEEVVAVEPRCEHHVLRPPDSRGPEEGYRRCTTPQADRDDRPRRRRIGVSRRDPTTGCRT